MNKRTAGFVVVLLALMAWSVPLFSQENALDWASPRTMSLGMATAGSDAPSGDSINPASSAGIQRYTLDLNVFGLFGTDPVLDPGIGLWVNAGGVIPTLAGNFGITGHFGYSPFQSMPFGTLGGLNLSFSKDLMPDLDFGIGLGFQIGAVPADAALPQSNLTTDWGLGLDLGFIHKIESIGFIKDFRWGIAIRGLGKPYGYSGPYGAMPPPFTPSIGTQFKLIKTKEVVWAFNLDVAAPSVQNLQVTPGIDLKLFELFSVQVSYDFDLVQYLNRTRPDGYSPTAAITKASSRVFPLNFGISIFSAGFNAPAGSKSDDSASEAAGDSESFSQTSEFNPSAVFSPLNNGVLIFGIGMNMPIGVIDQKPPVLEIGDPVFEDDSATDPLPADETQPEQTATTTSSAWVIIELPIGADNIAPITGSGASPEPSTSPAVSAVPAPLPSPVAVPVIDPARASGLATGTPAYISPNFDGIRDTLTLPLTIKDDRPIASFTLYITDFQGKVVRTIRNKEERPETVDIGQLFNRLFRLKTGLPVPKNLVWDGQSDAGMVVADGVYAYQVEAADDNNNISRTGLRPVIVDTRAPLLEADSSAPSFAPGGDRPVLVFSLQSGETLAPTETWTGSVLAKDGKAVRTWKWKDKLPNQTIWDGKNDQGVLAADGIYSFHLATADKAGNKASAEVENLLLLNKPTPVGLMIDNGYFSPNLDNIKDAVTVSIDANDQVKVTTWSAKLIDSKGAAVRNFSGSDALPKTLVVDGKDDSGKALPEDVYKLSLTALYENGNNPTSMSPTMTLDLTKPSIKVTAEYPVFSPNGDGFKDALMLKQAASPEPLWESQIISGDGQKIRSFTWRGQPDDALIWDGRDSANNIANDGSYTYQATATDLAGNVGLSTPVVIKIDNRPTSVSIRAARPAFAPATDSQFKTMSLSLDEKLTEGINTWTVRILPAADSARTGTPVAGFSGKGNPPDDVAWDGKKTDKSLAEDGTYVAELTVVYDKGDQPQSWTSPFTIKNRRPNVKLTADNLFFSPDGDGKQDAITFNQTTTNEESWTGTISDSKDNIVKTMTWPGQAASQFVWDGTDNNGNKAPDGDYKYFLATTDLAGNQASARVTPVKLQTIKPELSMSVGSIAFSPKADSPKNKQTMELHPVLKLNSDDDIKDWKLQINPAAGGNARNITGSGKVPETLLWDGKTDGGRLAPEGDYLAILTVNYKSGQTPNAQSPKFALDITPPAATVFADPVLFSPNSDGLKDKTTLTQELSKETNWKATISFAILPSANADPVVRSFTWSGTAPKTIAWDGTNTQGIVVPDGRYLYQIEAIDAAGNSGKSAATEIRIDNRATPIAIKADKRWFSPVIDAKNRQILSPAVVLAEGIENWQLEVRNASSGLVKTFKGTNTPPASLEWDGKSDAGSMSPDGDYTAAFTVSYLKGNKPTVKTDVFTMDTKAPEIKLAAVDLVFSPDPESHKPVVKIGQSSSTEEIWEGSVQSLDGKVIKSYFWKGQAQDFAWDGRDDNGNLQKDGAYKYLISSTDKAGNTTRQELKGLTIDTRATPVLLIADAKGFAPGTGRAAASTINFKPMLTLTDGVSGWTLRMLNNSQQGQVVRTITGNGLPPASLSWDGLGDDKTRAPEGKYEASLTVEYKKGNTPDARTNPFVLDISAPKAQVAGAPKPFSPDDDGIDDEVTISIAVEDLSPIKDWTLEILDPQGTHFVTFSGSGTPTSRIIWNGHSDTGELVQAALDYTAVLNVTDNLGNKGTYREAVPVDVLVLRDGNDLRIRIPGITFPSNSPDLNSKDLKPEQLVQNARTLDRLAEILRKYGSYQIVVEGHANITQYWSAVDADKENRTELQPLSEKRAQAVKDALAKRGIAASRLSTVGVGGMKPVVANNDLANVWKNRRVEFILRK